MSRPFEKLTYAERIVYLFVERATELHRVSIETACRMTAEQVDQAMPRAKDILAEEHRLRLTPIIERDGWWTCEPTRRIAALALDAAIKRNLGEWERYARVFFDFDDVTEAANVGRSGALGTNALLKQALGEHMAVSPSMDYVVERVDAATTHGKGFVERTPEAVAA